MIKKKIGLYFGSFNPIHVGHLIIASHIYNNSHLDQIWFVVSPLNPFKKKINLLDNYSRLNLVNIAIKNFSFFKASNIEFSLPIPSYTINTLEYIKEKFPEYEFSLLMGKDNLSNFKKWKNYEIIIKNHNIFVYPRLNCKRSIFEDHKNIKLIDAPIIEISSSMIRSNIKSKIDFRAYLPEEVWNYIDEMNFYK